MSGKILFELGKEIFAPCEKENPVDMEFTTLVFIVVSPDVLGRVGPTLLLHPFIKKNIKDKIGINICFIFKINLLVNYLMVFPSN